MEDLIQYLPYLIPLFILQFALMFIALFHVLKHEKYQRWNRTIWILIVVFINIIGPILYFTLGRVDE